MYSQVSTQTTAADVNKYIARSNEYRNKDLDSALIFAEKAIKLSRKVTGVSKDSVLEIRAEAFNAKGICHVISGNQAEALESFTQTLEIYDKLSDSTGIASTYNNMGNTGYYFSDFENALANYLKALEINEKIGDDLGIAKNTGNIGNIYEKLGQYQKALDYYFQSLKVNQRIDNPNSVANAYMNIGLIYHNLGKDSLNIVYQEKAIRIFRQLEQNPELGKAYNNLAVSYEALNDFENALRFNEKALEIRKAVGDTYGQTITLHNVGYCYYRLNEYSKALNYLEQSLRMAKNNGYDFMLEKNYDRLALVHQALKNFEQALNYRIKHSEVKDSLYKIETAKEIAEIETKYQTEKKEAENKRLKIQAKLDKAELAARSARQKLLWIVFMTTVIMVVFVSAFVIYRRKAITQKRLQEEEKLRFKAIIKAEEKERTRIAKDLHDGLGQLLSTAKLNVASLEESVLSEDKYLINNAGELIDNAVTEVRNISHNLMPLALTRLGLISAVEELTSKMNASGLLNVHFKSEGIKVRLNSSVEIAVYRVIQEILNNTIKHSQAKEVYVLLKKSNNRLHLEISDNGIGFDTQEIEKSKGIGWKSIFSRVEMLNGSIDVSSNKYKGTNLTVSIPLNE